MDENKDVNEYGKKFLTQTIAITDNEDGCYKNASLLSENCKYDIETAELRYILDENCKKLSEGFNKSTIKLTFHCCNDQDGLTYKTSMICKKFYTRGECTYDYNYSKLNNKRETKYYEKEKLDILLSKFKTKIVVDNIIECAKEIGRCEIEETQLIEEMQKDFRDKLYNTKEALREYKALLSDNEFKIISVSEVDGYTVEVYGRITEK